MSFVDVGNERRQPRRSAKSGRYKGMLKQQRQNDRPDPDGTHATMLKQPPPTSSSSSSSSRRSRIMDEDTSCNTYIHSLKQGAKQGTRQRTRAEPSSSSTPMRSSSPPPTAGTRQMALLDRTLHESKSDDTISIGGPVPIRLSERPQTEFARLHSTIIQFQKLVRTVEETLDDGATTPENQWK